MNYYPHHIGDFNNATRHLTRIERSIYRDLIELYYDTEKPIAVDMPSLCRRILARSEEEQAAVASVLSEFFVQSEEGWLHERCQKEITHYYAKSEKAKVSAAKRWSKAEDADAMPTHTARTPNQNQNQNHNQEPFLKTNVAPSAPVTSPEIELVFEFWKTAMKSPRSMLDDKRRKAIKSALKTGYTAEQLCDAISGCAKSDFHMGKNDKGLKYNGLDLILRNAEYIDKFIVIGNSPLVPVRPTNGRPSINDMDDIGSNEDDIFELYSRKEK